MPYLMLILVLLFSCSTKAVDDPEVGAKTYAAKGCIGCHGPAGKSPSPGVFPVLAGKDAAYIKEQLTAFKNRIRNNPMMTPMAAGLSDDDIENIANYLSAQ